MEYSLNYLNNTSKLEDLTLTYFIDKLNIIENVHFEAPLLGDFQFDNLLCSIGAIFSKGFSIKEISKTLKYLKTIPGRLEVIQNKSQKNNKTRQFFKSSNLLLIISY
jgi:UDP-N-acetylmuramyl tripeptide synthase